MSRVRIWIATASAFAVLALGWNNAASAAAGLRKPVRACEAVKSVPVCQPVQKTAPPVPVCQPVKVCERADGYVKREVLRGHLALRARPVGHVWHHHD
jgi:hypothetical protein